MGWILDRFDEDAFNYWTTIAVAVFFVWRAGQVDVDHDSMFYLFAATYLIIHAHGRRILAAINRRDHQNTGT